MLTKSFGRPATAQGFLYYKRLFSTYPLFLRQHQAAILDSLSFKEGSY